MLVHMRLALTGFGPAGAEDRIRQEPALAGKFVELLVEPDDNASLVTLTVPEDFMLGVSLWAKSQKLDCVMILDDLGTEFLRSLQESDAEITTFIAETRKDIAALKAMALEGAELMHMLLAAEEVAGGERLELAALLQNVTQKLREM